MNKKIIIISIISIILYTFLLFCLGIFGEIIQRESIIILKYIIKYGLIGLGYLLGLILPYKIFISLNKRKEKLYQIASDKKIKDIAEYHKYLNEKILEEKIKSEGKI